MASLSIEATGGADYVKRAAMHDRRLRSLGITVRNTVDVLVATFCIDNGFLLLHNDRDFDAFGAHRGSSVRRHVPNSSRDYD